MSTPDEDTSTPQGRKPEVASTERCRLKIEAIAQAVARDDYWPHVLRYVRFRGTCRGESNDPVIELQVLDSLENGRYPENYFAHATSEAAIVALLSKADNNLCGSGTYYIPNEVNPAVKARAKADDWHVQMKKGGTSDRDILSRRVVYFDCDVLRPSGISTTDAERELALDVAVRVYAQLEADLGSGQYLGVGLSGNGYQVHVALDSLPNNDAVTATVRALLLASKYLFSTDKVEIDTGVSDPKRLCPAFGTMKRKGVNDPERPHRKSWFWCEDEVLRLTPSQLDDLLATWIARLTPEQRAEVDKSLGKKPAPPASKRGTATAPSRPSGPAVNYQSGVIIKPGPFGDANAISVQDVADWLGFVRDGLPVCPGCGTTGDSSVAFVGNGIKCMHARCSQKGRSGFRTPVDLVVEVKGVTPIEAVKLMLAQFALSTAGSAGAGMPATRPGQQAVTLITGKQGQPISSAANVMTVLELDPRWADVIVYDEFREAVVVRRAPPCRYDDAPQRRTSPEWTEQDSTRTAAWLLAEYGLDVRSCVIEEAVSTVAQKCLVHPVRDYLRSLAWDGKPRLDAMLPVYFGTDDTPYTRGVGPRWMISAVARVECPGCQVDCMLVLESRKQGTGKTSGFRTLAPEPSLYNDTGLTIGDKDSYQNLRGVFIYGFDELDSIRRSELTKTKNFISQTRDRYRPSYGRRARDFERQNVFCGTTNEEQYLADRTGNRRIWPVRVQRDVDVAAIERDRDQLWAEAFARYSVGEKWHVNTPEFRKLCEEQQADRVQADPWEPLVARWLDSPVILDGSPDKPEYSPYDASNGVRTLDVLLFAIGMRADVINKGHEMRVADVLKVLGYARGARRRENGVEVRRYVRETTSRWSPNEVVSAGGRPETTGNHTGNGTGDHLDHLDGQSRGGNWPQDRVPAVREDDPGGRGGRPLGAPGGPTAKEDPDGSTAAGPPPSTTSVGDHLPDASSELGSGPPASARSIPRSPATHPTAPWSGRVGWREFDNYEALEEQLIERHLAKLEHDQAAPAVQETSGGGE